GDAAEVARIVHHGHEEVGGGDDAVLIVDLPDGGVVAGFRPDEELRVGGGRRLSREELLENRWRQLASAAAAVRQIGQAGRSLGGGHFRLSNEIHRAAPLRLCHQIYGRSSRR